MSEFLRIQKERIHYRYHALRNVWPFWFWILNYQARSHFSRHRPTLNALQQRITSSLIKDGIASVHISELFPDTPDLFAKLSAYTDKLWNDPKVQQEEIPAKLAAIKDGKRSKSEKYFFVFLLSGGDEAQALDLADPFMRFNMNPRITDVVASYLGMSPKFHSYSLRSTLTVPAGSPPLLSQKWHRDPDDKKMCKVFLYLTDVTDEGAGPFMYVKGSQYGGKWRHKFPQRPPVGVYPPPGAVEQAIPKEDIKICTAPAGTIIFADTSGLHRGGYSTTARRVMSFADFTSPATIQKPIYLPPSEDQLRKLSPIASYALKRDTH